MKHVKKKSYESEDSQISLPGLEKRQSDYDLLLPFVIPLVRDKIFFQGLTRIWKIARGLVIGVMVDRE